MQFEADIWNERDYNGRVHFLRKEGYFDDLHREWDKHDDAEQAQKDLKELADDPEPAADDGRGLHDPRTRATVAVASVGILETYRFGQQS